jgi:hypothetical protein
VPVVVVDWDVGTGDGNPGGKSDGRSIVVSTLVRTTSNRGAT